MRKLLSLFLLVGSLALILPPDAPLAAMGSQGDINQALAAYKSKNYSRAFQLFRPLAKSGNAKAEAYLGWMYGTGQGVKKDDAKALKWYRRAAEQGNVDGQDALGLMYEHGQGVNQDYAKALKWHRKAAEQGSVDGQDALGWMYERGQGVNQDYAKAVKWYRKAAEQGSASSQSNLGSMYFNGQGVTQNYVKAVKWWRKAAEQGDADGQVLLGLMYEGTKNYVEAYKWMALSVTQGNSAASKDMGSLIQKMTPDQITKAQELVAQWKMQKLSSSRNIRILRKKSGLIAKQEKLRALKSHPLKKKITKKQKTWGEIFTRDYPNTFAFMADMRAYFNADSEGNSTRFKRFTAKNYVRDPEWEESHNGLPNLFGSGINKQVQDLVGECYKYSTRVMEADQTQILPSGQYLQDYQDAIDDCNKAETFLRKCHYIKGN